MNLRRASSVAFVSFMFAMGGGLATGHASDDLLTPVEAPWTQSVTFSLSNLAGEKRTLEDFSGKVVLVNFWATWCRPCIKELPSIEELKDRLQSEPFDVVAINVGEDKAQIEDFLSKRLGGPLAIQVLLDDNMVATKAWKVRAVPTTYVVDKSGRIAFVATGETDFAHDQIVEEIRSLLARS